MESYSVEAILSAVDKNFSSTMKDADKTMNGLNSSSKKTRTSILDIAKGVGVFKVVQGGITLAKNAIVGLGTELSASSATWKTFTGNMVNLGKSKSEIASVKKELQDFATQTIYSASDMATTYSQLEAVGIKSSNKLVKGFGGLAAAAENPKQAMKTLSQQATQMAAKPTVQWMDFKLMLEQTPAGMAAVAKTMGVTTSELVKNVQDGTVKTQEFFDAVAKTGTNETFGKMATEYKTVGQAMDGLSETLVTKLQPAFDKLSGVGIKAVEGIIGKLEKFDFDKLVSSVSTGATKVIEYFNKIWESLKKGLKGFDMTGFKKIFETIASVAKVAFGVILAVLPTVVEWVGKLATFFSKVVTAIQPFLPILIPIFTAWAAFMIKLKGISTVIRIFNTFKTVISGVATTFKILTSIMAANPFVLIVGAIVGLVAAFIYFWNTSEEFRNFWIGLWESIKGTFSAAWETMKAALLTVWDTIIALLTPIVVSVMEIFSPMITFFIGLWEQIKTIAGAAWELIKAVIMAPILLLIDLVTGDFNRFKEDLSMIWTTIKDSISTIVLAVVRIVIGYFKAIFETGKNIFNGLKDFFSGIWGSIKETASNAWQSIKDTASRIWGDMVDGVSNLVNDIFGWFDKIKDIDLLEAGRAIIDSFLKGLKEKYEGVKDFIGGIGDWIRDHKGPIRVDRKLLIPAGNAIMEGLNNGLDNGFGAVQDNVSSMGDRLSTNFDIGSRLTSINSQIQTKVQHEVSYGTNSKPAQFNVRIGNSEFSAFLDDISQAQGNEINLNMQFRG
ncbi:tape measure protein [Enterococcus lactis]|uniref:phage tail protein n=1 Tax=Enterococcus lactis TaxID=357441 RepID=UPI00288FB334|nr:tape measure protein [Enterococcus lactis]MDT2780162.1 tape measure protein [Enterococcus lactis]